MNPRPLDPHPLTLLLVDDSPDAVAPFSAATPRTWVGTTAEVADEQPIDDPEQCVPYPLLVALGHTQDATLVMNLEAAGTLAIVGDDDGAVGVQVGIPRAGVPVVERCGDCAAGGFLAAPAGPGAGEQTPLL